MEFGLVWEVWNVRRSVLDGGVQAQSFDVFEGSMFGSGSESLNFGFSDSTGQWIKHKMFAFLGLDISENSNFLIVSGSTQL